MNLNKKYLLTLALSLFSGSSLADDPGPLPVPGGEIFDFHESLVNSDFPGEKELAYGFRIKHTNTDFYIAGPSNLDIAIRRETNGNGSIFNEVSLEVAKASSLTEGSSIACLGLVKSVSFNNGFDEKNKNIGFDNSIDVPDGTVLAFSDNSLLACDGNSPVVYKSNGNKYTFTKYLVLGKYQYKVNKIINRFGDYIQYHYEDFEENYTNDSYRIDKITRSDGVVVNYTYSRPTADKEGKNPHLADVLSEISFGDRKVSYAYNYAGRYLTTFTDEEGKTTTYKYAQYTGLHALERVTLYEGAYIEYKYEPISEALVVRLPNKVTGQKTSFGLSDYGYSGGGLLTKKIHVPGKTDRTFLYKSAGGEIGTTVGYKMELNVIGEADLTYKYVFKKLDLDLLSKTTYVGELPEHPFSLGRDDVSNHEKLVTENFNWQQVALGTRFCIPQLTTRDRYDNFHASPRDCKIAKLVKHTKVFDYEDGSDTFKTEYLAYDSFQKPIKVKQSYNNNIKYSHLEYFNQATPWVLGSFKKFSISENGSDVTEVSRQEYNNFSLTGVGVMSLPSKQYRYGELISEIKSYNSDGHVNTLEYNSPLLGDKSKKRYKRTENFKSGIAQNIYYPGRYNAVQKIEKAFKVDSNGWIVKETDENSNVVNLYYDDLGRLKGRDITSDEHYEWKDESIGYSRTQNNIASCVIDERAVCIGNSLNTIKIEKLDGLGRVVQRIVYDHTDNAESGANTRYKNLAYDQRGNLVFESRWSVNEFEDKGATKSYDGLGRLTSVSVTGQGSIKYKYLSGNKIEVTDAEGNVTVTSYRSYGRPEYKIATNIASPENVTTSIEIDVFGLVKSVTQSGGGKIFKEIRKYDSSKQLCLIKRADVGSTVLKYNILGELIWQKKGVENNECVASPPAGSTKFEYDNMGSIYKIDYPDDDLDVVYFHDNKGNILNLTAGDITHLYNYNNLDLLEDETLTIGSEGTLQLDYEYDSLGNYKAITYPDGTYIEYAPNGFGEPTKVFSKEHSFASNATYYASGMLHTFTYGNGVKHITTLDLNTLRPIQIQDVRGSSNIVKLGYSYDNNNNVKSITDYLNGGEFSLTNLEYDGLDRLTGVTGRGSIGNSSISYDSLGNIESYSSKNRNLTYSYNVENNRLTSVTGEGTDGKYSRIQYDTRGNITHNGKYGLTFNVANQLQTAKGNTYFYDGHNRRVKQIDGNGVSYTMYSQSGVLLYREKGGLTGDGVNYIYLGKKLIAKHGALEAQNSEVSRQHYRPYGETIETPKDDVGFTGHKFDTDLGLSYMQARYYDPVIGRFYSNDPLGFRDVHSFNRYAYANNNPYKYVDPDGMAAESYLNRPMGVSIKQHQQAMAKAGRMAITRSPAGMVIGASIGVITMLNESTNLADDAATDHILDGDKNGGGHGPGRGKPGKSEFPSSWTDDEVMDAISDVATDPESTVTPAREGRSKVRGKRRGIKIEVITGNEQENGKIITGYPNDKKIPRNPPEQQD
ncbi:hypothetical protein EXT48_18900 [Pseudoalteromonas sp. CO348]|uniref:RHS repeat-associated core domain-containing protein n=1 Tax=unclassified Pseudoalteromonas TaxID=194690 RepID=UPI0010236725|nr:MULTISPECIES: RHS repeat-associated core domain-containing protein [unclassified Pseudoalteromonas]MCG7539172.1 EndoU domain-containing protein [Pseudoalteromonas sp. OF7H-1]RZG00127.1 hypothetical protein EXT48_18900 [Pseudoalteromonas sp. CO348]